jgi:Raf kinase inhibitor-like YbhB/YbcL family protein
MRLLEFLGRALRPVRSDEGKLIEQTPDVATKAHGIKVFSPVFKDGATLPKEYTADGAGHFPTLAWSDVPAECKSILLVVEDPDAPKPSPFVHGVFFNILPGAAGLPDKFVTQSGISQECAALGVRMGTNSLSKPTYMAPTPPPGHGPHHYHFQVIALDTILNFAKSPSLADIKEVIHNHVVESGEIVGIYERHK